MQLTRFDRWLRKKFVHETHLYSLRPPEIIPSGVKSEELPDEPGRQYRFRYTIRSEKAVDAMIRSFNEHNQMFATRVIDRKTWYIPLVAPKNNKSVTWWCAWVLISCIAAFFLTNAIRALWSNPEFRKNLAESIEILKG